MTIIEKEIVGTGVSTGLDIPNVPLGIFIEDIIKENVKEHGDANYLVAYLFILTIT